MTPIPKGVRNKHRFNPALDVEAVTVPCTACSQEFTGKDALEAMVFLVEHLRSIPDAKHKKEYEWLKTQAMTRDFQHGADA